MKSNQELFKYNSSNKRQNQQGQEGEIQIQKKIKPNEQQEQIQNQNSNKKKIKFDINEVNDYLDNPDPEQYLKNQNFSTNNKTKLSTQQLQEQQQQQQEKEQQQFKQKYQQYSELIQCDEENQIETQQIEQLEEITPWWAKKDTCKDQDKLSINDYGYNPSKLYIPPGEFKKLSPVMQQYWLAKSNHFDKIILFQIGNFYELFYDDALIAHQILNLQWKNNKMHASFHQKQLKTNVEILVSQGYKVGLVEQQQQQEDQQGEINKQQQQQINNSQVSQLKQKQQKEQQEEEKKINPKQSNQQQQSKQGLIFRQLTQIFTQGCNLYGDNLQDFQEQQQADDEHQIFDYEPKYIMTIRMENNNNQEAIQQQQSGPCFGICIIEISTNTITLGHIREVNKSLNLLKTLLWQVRPVEVVLETSNIPANIIKIIQQHGEQQNLGMTNITQLQDKNQQWHFITANELLQNVYGKYYIQEQNLQQAQQKEQLNQSSQQIYQEEESKDQIQNEMIMEKQQSIHQQKKQAWPAALQYFIQQYKENEKNLVFSALAGGLSYLKDLLILDEVLQAVRFQVYDYQKNILQQCMLLDAAALQHLEVLEPQFNSMTTAQILKDRNLDINKKQNSNNQDFANNSSNQANSLFQFINKAVTPNGRRMLRQWICAPLLSIDRLNERLDALEDLQNIREIKEEFQNSFLKKLPDLERVCARVYRASVQYNKQQQKSKQLNYIHKLKEFRDLLKNLKSCEDQIIEKFKPSINAFKSRRLKRLVSYDDELVELQQAVQCQQQQQLQQNNSLNKCDLSSISQISNKSQQNSQQAQIQSPNYLFNVEDEMDDYSFLRSLNYTDKANGLLPHVAEMIDDFENVVQWIDGLPIPLQGINVNYDSAALQVEQSRNNINEYLHNIRQEIGDQFITFKQNDNNKILSYYELVMSENSAQKLMEISQNKQYLFEITGKKGQGIIHGQTEQLINLATQLEKAEEEEQKQLTVFIQSIFRQFFLKQKYWNALIQIISELDCLCALNTVSFKDYLPLQNKNARGNEQQQQNQYIMSRPILVEAKNKEDVILELRDARHPCLCRNGLFDFVPNDVLLGDYDNIKNNNLIVENQDQLIQSIDLQSIFQQQQIKENLSTNFDQLLKQFSENDSQKDINQTQQLKLQKQQSSSSQNFNVMILTGPNMGGKSTVLRMACVNAILAQIGCYVPARICKMSVVDRIFTRMGVSDKLIEGKSTFFLEMEEMSLAIQKATFNSLVIIDELGRGTSTFDGVAIAYSVLRYIAENIQCRTIFATHYHVLLDEFRLIQSVAFFHMASEIDQQSDRIKFLYKLLPGESAKSFGINVAKVVGIDPQLIVIAENKAQQFEDSLNQQRQISIEQAASTILNIVFQDENQQQNFLIEQLQQVLENNKLQ